MMMFDKGGKRISPGEWARLLENETYRRVAQTALPDGRLVSTVWLGIDHNFLGGLPVIFETMMFLPDGKTLDCERYTTEEEARQGHEEMVRRASGGVAAAHGEEVRS